MNNHKRFSDVIKLNNFHYNIKYYNTIKIKYCYELYI